MAARAVLLPAILVNGAYILHNAAGHLCGPLAGPELGRNCSAGRGYVLEVVLLDIALGLL